MTAVIVSAATLEVSVPAAVDESITKHYRQSMAVTEYKEFPARSHFTFGESGWEEVADYALNWAAEHAPASAPASNRFSPPGSERGHLKPRNSDGVCEWPKRSRDSQGHSPRRPNPRMARLSAWRTIQLRTG